MSDFTVFGDRVKLARLIRKKTSSDVAAAMKWAPATQTRLENSLEKLVPGLVRERLSEFLRVPPEFFSVGDGDRGLDIADLRFRAPKSTTKQEKGHLVAFARATSEVASWLDALHRLPPVRVPHFTPDADVVKVASSVREALGIGPVEPIKHLMHSVERSGVMVVVRTLTKDDIDRWDRDGDSSIENPEIGERHFGFSVWSGKFRDRPMMTLRDITSWERTRWTVAHELGHLVLHGSELPADAEAQASRFANELLAPAAGISEELGSHVTLADLVSIKMRWGISLGALIRHLRNSNLISLERFEALRKQLYTRINPATGRTWGVDEPGWDELKPERPRMLSSWAERCVGTSNPAALAQINRIWPADILATMFSAQRKAASSNGSATSSLSAARRSGSVSQIGEKDNVVDFPVLRRAERG